MAARRIGVIVPSSNTVVEQDFAASQIPGVSVHTARMYLAETTAEKEREMISIHAPRAARDLGTAACDVAVFACTSAGALIGLDGEARLVAELAEVAGCPVISTNEAVARKLKEIGAERVAVVTAYIDELNIGIRRTLEERGVHVTEIHGMGITDNVAIADVGPAQIVEFARRHIDDRDIDALFVSCTNLPAMESLDALTAEFGVPVITSNSATIDAVRESTFRRVK
ncbi:aspartate/glutamate racemase family protein [Pseudactinotalea sp. HY158]|uniref:maleate cis-trans isomerase family protein n=1 Tax=Pseudactinotalea sp. HY158 TaxID=2654547 RepID=UPI00129C28A0|nr:aspartate/glutamate racemase family protein [Pseudactinotalea sp. HY158]QGH70703.1 Asp/Glu racemase [Pseudactinotalea sp. HY158]